VARAFLQDWDKYGSRVPLLVNLMPSGKYLMEDLFYAGGLPVVLRELLDAGVLNGDALTVNGKAIGDNVRSAECYNRDVIYPASAPLQKEAGIALLKVRVYICVCVALFVCWLVVRFCLFNCARCTVVLGWAVGLGLCNRA
jgi:dihydroxyacid dehydratase/phosphogluconate dehydratase